LHLSSFRTYGDFVPFRIVHHRAFYVFHPDAIEEILVTKARDFTKSIALRLLTPILGNGLLLSDGDFWLRQRRLVQPGFHRQRVAGYGEVMAAYAEEMLAAWKDGATLDAHDEMMKVTQAIVAKTLFDANVGGTSTEVSDAVETSMKDFFARLRNFVPVPSWVPTPGNLRARRAVEQLDAVVYRMIAARRKSGEDRGDVLSMLLHAQDADDGTRMTDKQVRDEVMTLFLAGHETTAVALSWTWYLLAQNPRVEAALGEELRTVLNGRAPTVADLPKLRYTAMVIDEAMRLYPPAYALSRQVVRDTEIAGYAIPARAAVVMPAWVTQRDPRWFDSPEEFRPERWADDFAKKLPRFAYFPFGGGPRQCIGNTFALMEAVLLLAAFARRFRLELVPGQQIRPVPYVTLRPEPGIRMVLRRR
jgi:cytochrome P450